MTEYLWMILSFFVGVTIGMPLGVCVLYGMFSTLSKERTWY